jgi:hypothetical protein
VAFQDRLWAGREAFHVKRHAGRRKGRHGGQRRRKAAVFVACELHVGFQREAPAEDVARAWIGRSVRRPRFDRYRHDLQPHRAARRLGHCLSTAAHRRQRKRAYDEQACGPAEHCVHAPAAVLRRVVMTFEPSHESSFIATTIDTR